MLNRFMVGKLPQKLEKLRGSLHFLDAEAPPGSRHTFFVDSSEEASQLDPAQHLGTSQVSGECGLLFWPAEPPLTSLVLSLICMACFKSRMTASKHG